jgi:thymidylate synthase ThyX
VQYPTESFSAAEHARLAPHFTHPDRPVFALVNLPETVKGALFARYSRYPGTLRRLFLDEFADSLGDGGVAGLDEREEGSRAAELYERIFVGYGDDSVAQLGGMHVACEYTSNVLTKVLQRPGSGPTSSSRRATSPTTRRWRARARTATTATLRSAPSTSGRWTGSSTPYAQALPRTLAWVEGSFPGDVSSARTRACKAKALDLLRGLLPAASLSHMGIYATGQTYEQLILHLLAHPLPEARQYGAWILDAVKAVMPSFVSRVERPDRGGAWVEHLQARDAAADRWVRRLGLDRPGRGASDDGPSVRLLHVDGDEESLLAALLFEAAGVSEEDARIRIAALSGDERHALLADLVGERANRRHRPGRGFEALRYRFEIVADYGAFRDLQRHRMLTVQWQGLTPDLGAGVPAELEDAGVADAYRAGLDASAAEYARLAAAGHERAAVYALSLGFRIRFVLDLNAREAMHLVELRSGREGHPAYRAVAHEMHRQITAVHPAVGAAMTHVDEDTEPRLERILSEMRTQAKLDALA